VLASVHGCLQANSSSGKFIEFIQIIAGHGKTQWFFNGDAQWKWSKTFLDNRFFRSGLRYTGSFSLTVMTIMRPDKQRVQ
jgi:hypothetical protein